MVTCARAILKRRSGTNPAAWFTYAESVTLQVWNRSIHDLRHSPYPVRCTIEWMKIPPDVRAAITEIARMFGRQGGKASART